MINLELEKHNTKKILSFKEEEYSHTNVLINFEKKKKENMQEVNSWLFKCNYNWAAYGSVLTTLTTPSLSVTM